MRRSDERRAGRRRRSTSCKMIGNPLSYWRRLPAGAFDLTLRTSLRQTIRKIGSTLPDWKAAVAGDAGAAVGIVLRLHPPFRISARTDLAMSLLLNCAFESAGAALVLSHSLRRMRLSRSERRRLADSWLAHHGRLAKSGKTKRAIGLRHAGRGRHDNVRPAHDPWGEPDDAA
ncbi:hypothetical protein [Bradyrhizobium genosp. SA-4]|uniref:hypothetical protein n=1 Tax=Bradyrhizobium genosp. SA-4 TaxID=508869 RepID=UPI0012EC32A0|nr:hypothetical protein [Bradyrhizobium genosp. SA-4]